MAGGGYKTFTAGSILTAADVNSYLADQSCMYFATTTARDAAITAPSDGMLCYIGSNDASEGLYTYNGTSWRKGPGWNAPWGYLTTISGSAVSTVLRAGASSAAVDFVSGSYTHVNNRRVRVTAMADATWTTGTNSRWEIKQGSTGLAYSDQQYTGNFNGVTLVGVTTTDGTSQTYKCTWTPGGSVSAVTVQGIVPAIWIEDIGPSGAPV